MAIRPTIFSLASVRSASVVSITVTRHIRPLFHPPKAAIRISTCIRQPNRPLLTRHTPMMSSLTGHPATSQISGRPVPPRPVATMDHITHTADRHQTSRRPVYYPMETFLPLEKLTALSSNTVPRPTIKRNSIDKVDGTASMNTRRNGRMRPITWFIAHHNSSSVLIISSPIHTKT